MFEIFHTGQRHPYGLEVIHLFNIFYRFKTKNQLLLHTMAHSNLKAYKCKDCDKAFNTPNSLRSHKKCHDDILSYECKFCGRKFRFPSTLKVNSLGKINILQIYH